MGFIVFAQDMQKRTVEQAGNQNVDQCHNGIEQKNWKSGHWSLYWMVKYSQRMFYRSCMLSSTERREIANLTGPAYLVCLLTLRYRVTLNQTSASTMHRPGTDAIRIREHGSINASVPVLLWLDWRTFDGKERQRSILMSTA